jgi:carbamoyltransferase
MGSARQFVSMHHRHGGRNIFDRYFGPTKAKVRFVDHHLAHAISSYCFSGSREATIVIVDGRGAWEATSVWYGHDGYIDHVLTLPWPNSLGLFYAAFTYYLGFDRYSDEWKVMGLAPYGGPGVNMDSFIDFEHNPYQVNARRLMGRDYLDLQNIEALLGPRRQPESEIDGRYKEVAYAVQEACERAMERVVELAVKKTGCRNLCLAGGVALNSKANGKILTSGLVDHIFVQPASGDDGTALGAAMAPYLETENRLPLNKMRHVYLGPESSDEEIEQCLKKFKIRHTLLDDPARVGSEMLQDGRILGWFQGRMEFGPRALGSRSILADARDPKMKDKVNNAVKFREWWRPFAPSMLAEAGREYLEHACESPFMVLTFQVRPEKANLIPAVTHLDGSARVQIVDQDVNPLYWRLIKDFGKCTGVPVIMNTSFNLRGEAIVPFPADAIRSFYSSGLDALIIGRCLVEK